MDISLIQKYLDMIIGTVVQWAPTVIGALLTLFVGMRIIGKISHLVNKGFEKAKIDKTVSKFLANMLSVVLKVLLLITVAGMFGVQTTSFIALIGAAGLAVGLALQGSLSNFAGGVLILLFKPYQVGDFIETQGIFGKVEEIGIFVTQIHTPENKTAIVPNGTIANGNIINHTKIGNVRVDVNVGIAYDEDIDNTRAVLMKVIEANQHLLKKAGTGVFVNELADSSVNLIVRGFTKPGKYRNAYFTLTEECKKALDSSGISIPFPHRVIHTVKD